MKETGNRNKIIIKTSIIGIIANVFLAGFSADYDDRRQFRYGL